MSNRLLVILLSVLASRDVFAWSWKDAVSMAIDKNPNLQAQKQNAEVFELRYKNAKALMYPRLSIRGVMQEFQNETSEFQYRATIGPRLQWLLYQGGKVRAGIHQADAIQKQTDINVLLTSVSTNSKLREAFAQAVYAKNFLDLAHRIEKQRQENVKITEIRYKSGLEYKWVFLSSTAKWKKAQLDVTRAEMNKKTALADLENMLGVLPIESVEEIDSADFYTSSANYAEDQLISKYNANPKYLFQLFRVEESESFVDVNRADQYPQIGIDATFAAGSVENRKLFPYWLATAGLDLPLFEGGRIRRNISIAKAQLSQRKFDLEQAELDVKATIKKTYLNYYVAEQQVDIGQLLVEANKDRAKVVSNQYRAGLATFLDWESSQDAWVNAEIDQLNNVRNYQINRARLEEAVGMELKI
jgi:outer membrane protein